MYYIVVCSLFALVLIAGLCFAKELLSDIKAIAWEQNDQTGYSCYSIKEALHSERSPPILT